MTMMLGGEYPSWGNNCWVLGHDLVAELRGREPDEVSERTFRLAPMSGFEPHTEATEVYYYDMDLENVSGYEDGVRVQRVEMGDYCGSKVVWVDDLGPEGKELDFDEEIEHMRQYLTGVDAGNGAARELYLTLRAATAHAFGMDEETVEAAARGGYLEPTGE